MGQWPGESGVSVKSALGPDTELPVSPCSNLGVSFFLAFVGGALASVAGPCIKAAMINVNDPESRGVALALQVGAARYR